MADPGPGAEAPARPTRPAAAPDPPSVASWLVPALAFVAIIGSLGIFTDLALNHLSWQEVIIWVAAVYAVAGTAIALATRRLRLVPNAAYGALSGVLAAGAIVMLFLALGAGEVSRVVPITSSYPVVTLMLAALILSERVSWARLGGTVLVIGGVILILME